MNNHDYQHRPSVEDISEFPANSRKRPPYSYVALILMAISQSPEQKLAVSGIYDYINQFSYYKQRYPKWLNSVRYTLSQNDCFIKVPRELHSNGRGSVLQRNKNYVPDVSNSCELLTHFCPDLDTGNVCLI